MLLLPFNFICTINMVSYMYIKRKFLETRLKVVALVKMAIFVSANIISSLEIQVH